MEKVDEVRGSLRKSEKVGEDIGTLGDPPGPWEQISIGSTETLSWSRRPNNQHKLQQDYKTNSKDHENYNEQERVIL